MIVHGNKHISEIVYARKASEGGGAVRLTNIIRGAQVVFGWLAPSFGRLKKATKAAILAAFGQYDGYAVIEETNAYLTALAATDPTKASALAGFINTYAVEDARIVISLVPTLGKRWIVGNSTTYLDTGRKMAANGSIEIAFRNGDSGSYPMLVGTDWGDKKGFAVDKQTGNTNTQITIRSFTSSTINTGYTDNLLYLSWTEFTLNGKTVTHKNTAIESGSTVYLGGVRSYDKWTGRIYYYKYKEDGADVTNYIPYCKNNVNGWIDLLSGTFYPPTSGTWGIADSYTPLNQTP